MPKHFDVVLILWRKADLQWQLRRVRRSGARHILFTYIDVVSFTLTVEDDLHSAHDARSPSGVLKDDRVYDGN